MITTHVPCLLFRVREKPKIILTLPSELSTREIDWNENVAETSRRKKSEHCGAQSTPNMKKAEDGKEKRC
jgi:hypothetical protein